MIEWMKAARPYAKAAFEYAVERKALSSWSQFLKNAETLVSNQAVLALIANPEITREQRYALIIEVLASSDDAQKNFIHLLANARKLAALPCVVADFEKMCTEHEKEMEVEITSAMELSQAQCGLLVKALAEKFQREIKYTCKIDENLLGGAVIRAGDKVIDGSGRGRLKQLADVLN